MIDARKERDLSTRIQNSRAELVEHVDALPAALSGRLFADLDRDVERGGDWSAATIETLLRHLDAMRGELPKRHRVTIDKVRECALRLYRAREALISANLRLVVHVAKTFATQNRPLLDLVQEGNIGLMRAAEKFDHRRGTKFSTYAHWWIKQAIQRAIADRGDIVRIPGRLSALRAEISEAAADLRQQNKQQPGNAEIAATVGVSAERVELALAVPRREIGLGADGSGESHTLDSVEDINAPDPVHLLERRELRGIMSRLLATLHPREAEILRLRFGLRERPRTLEEVGEVMSLSRERVRQLQSSALRKLREPATERGLHQYAV